MAKNTRKNGPAHAAAKPRITTEPQADNGNGHVEHEQRAQSVARLPVLKTYKIYVGGKFPRTESGRYYLMKNARGEPVANMCLCSRKDFRDAVVAARGAQSSWASKSAYNRGQI